MKTLPLITLLACLTTSSVVAQDYKPSVSVRYKLGNNRTIYSPEVFLPLAGDDRSLVFADLRSVISVPTSQEYNVGLGYRHFLTDNLIGGAYGFYDYRNSTNGNAFSQTTLGGELLAERWDMRLNTYIPLTQDPKFVRGTTTSVTPQGTGIFRTTGSRYEEALTGADIEAGVKPFEKAPVRVFGGGYWFEGDNTPTVKGVRSRLELEVHRFLRLGGEMQYDKVRGHNSFLEARVTIPLSWDELRNPTKRSAMQDRMITPIVRDIDIVTAEQSDDTYVTAPVLTTGGQQSTILYVDNSTTNGNGSYESPFNNLTDATSAATPGTIIYVREGDGTSNGLTSAYTVSQNNIKLMGSGTSYSLADLGLSIADPNGNLSNNTQLFAADGSPVLTSTGTGITISGNSVTVAGLTISGTTGDGIAVTGNDVVLHNLIISDTGATGIKLTNVSNATILNNTITNAGINGISGTFTAIAGSQQISGNTINGSTQNGVSMGYFTTSSNTLALTNNIMDDNTINSAFIRTNGSSSINLTATSNTITNTNTDDAVGLDLGRGIWYMAADTSVGHVEVTSNTFANNRGESVEIETKYSTAAMITGLLAYNTSNNAVSSTVNNADNSHFFVEGNTGGQVGTSGNRFLVYGNSATTATEEGIVFKATGGTVYGESYNNTTSYNDDGQEVRSLNGGYADVTFHNNISHHNNESGLQVDSVTDDGVTLAWLYNNTLYNNTGQGIQIASSANGDAGTLANPILVENNTITNNGNHNIIIKSTDGTTGTAYASIISNTLSGGVNSIYIVASNTNILQANIANNTLANATSRGVAIYGQGGTALNVSLTNNLQSGAVTQGLFADMRNTSTMGLDVVSNTFNNNTGDGMEFNIIHDAGLTGKIVSNTIHGNGDDGISYLVKGADTGADANSVGGYHGSAAAPIVITGNRIVSNTGDGIEIRSTETNGVGYYMLSGNTIVSNTARGVNLNEFDSTTASNGINVDMGGGAYGSTGGNAIYNNGGYNVFYNPDVNGTVLKAENNWWGQNADPATFDEAADSDGFNEFGNSNGGTMDATPWLTIAP